MQNEDKEITLEEENQIEALIALIENGSKEEILSLCEDMYPVDIAIALEDFNDENIAKINSLLDEKTMSEVLEQSEEDLAQKIMSILTDERALALFINMSKDDIVDILGNLPTFRRKKLINLMKSPERKIIQQLLGYEPDSAGGIMTTEYISLSETITVKNALKKIKEINPETEVIDTIFIVDEKNQLVGTVDLRDILISNDNMTMVSIMNDNVISVSPETDQEEVSILVSKYDLQIVPVINKRGSLLGIITVDDIVEIMLEEHTEDILQMGGVSKEENIDSTLMQSVKLRLPWLLVNLFTAFVASFVVSLFEGTIAKVVALAAVMPIVAGMGGNAGTQTLAIVVRSIALGEVNLKENSKLILKEIAVGFIDGTATGLITAVAIYLMYGNLYLALIVLAAMIGNLIIAGVSGFLVPLILKATGADPAVASSIFITTATDVFGFFLFLGLATTFLPFLL